MGAKKVVVAVPCRPAYSEVAYDRRGRELDWDQADGERMGHGICYSGLQPSRSSAGYTIVRIIVARRGAKAAGKRLAAVEVHLARHGKQGHLQVVGLVRE